MQITSCEILLGMAKKTKAIGFPITPRTWYQAIEAMPYLDSPKEDESF